MKLPMKIVWALVGVFIIIALTQIDFSAEKKKEKVEKPKEKIVEKAFHTDNLSTFVTALRTAELDDDLNSTTRITVFAPSDSAFASLPDGKFAELMEEGNKEELKRILSYHVVAGNVTTSDLKNGQVLQTIDGEMIQVSLADEGAKVNGTELVKTNIEASNGIIHVIDKVMIPSSQPNKAQALLRN